MFQQVFSFFITSISSVFSLLNSFSLDNGITLFHFFLFLIFAKIIILLINHIKDIREVQAEDERWLNNQMKTEDYREYRSWLRRHKK